VRTGIAIFAHGSVIESANQGVRDVAAAFAAAGEFALVEPAFLELGRPDLEGAVARLVERGAERIVVVPYFLTLGKHLQHDLPRIVERISSIHPGVPITVSAPLEGHRLVVDALVDRARAAAAAP
jgi:sirohydrochlorin ferrochelatase